jgi:hypothetical protein
MELEKYAEMLKKGDLAEISDWTLEKLLSHYIKRNATTFAILITRDVTQLADLEMDLNNQNLVYFRLKSSWENSDGSVLTEIGLFVLDIKMADILNLYTKYDTLHPNFEEPIDEMNIVFLKNCFENMKKNEYKLKGIQWIPTGMITNLALDSHLKK